MMEVTSRVMSVHRKPSRKISFGDFHCLLVGWCFLYKMPGFEIYDRNDENFHSIDERHEQKAPIASCNLCKLNSLRTPIKSQALQRLFSSSSAQFILCLFHAYSARFNALA